MYHFDFYMPAKVLFGEGRLQSLHEEKLPGKKALIATTNGKSVKKYGYLAALEKELDTAGVAYELFDQIRPNPTSDNVMDGAALAKKTGCDFAIALGGGSVMDCCKCIALMMTNDGDIWDYSLSVDGGKNSRPIMPRPSWPSPRLPAPVPKWTWLPSSPTRKPRKRPESSSPPCSRPFPLWIPT